MPSLVAVVALALSTLACGFFETASSSMPNPVATRTPWPTFTPTITSTPVAVAVAAEAVVITPLPPPQSGDAQVAQSAPTLAAPQLPTLAPTPAIPSPPPPPPGPETVPTEGSAAAPVTLPPTSTPIVAAAEVPPPTAEVLQPTAEAPPPTAEVPQPTETPAPTATPVPVEQTAGWSFASLRSTPGEDGLAVYGDMINNTGTSQELDVVSGVFYDNQGQVIAGERDVDGEWPIDVVPPGGRVPFKLVVSSIQNAAKFELGVEASPARITPRQDFEFVDLSQWREAGKYCVTGRLHNLGGELEEYLVIVAVLYDDQDKAINFDDYDEFELGYVIGGETGEFQLCADDFNQDVAHHELRAWGQ